MVYSVSADMVELSRTTVVCPSTTEYMVGAKVTVTPVGAYGKNTWKVCVSKRTQDTDK